MGTRLRPEKSDTPALSEPGLSALFWSTVLSGAQIFFSTFFCVQNHNTMRAVRADRLDFRAEKRPKRPNLSGQAGDTWTHLKALILIHNTSKKNGACHLPGPANRPVSAIDRRSGERNFFFQTWRGEDRGSLSQARGVGWVAALGSSL